MSIAGGGDFAQGIDIAETSQGRRHDEVAFAELVRLTGVPLRDGVITPRT